MNQTRRQRRINHAIRESEREYRNRILESWKEQTPSEYHGFDINHDLYEDHWGGHLSRGAVSKLKRYLNRPNKFLILRGTKGLGKSSLAHTLVSELLRSQIETTHYRSMPTLFDEFSWRDRDDISPVKRCSQVDMLVIDDIGAAGEQATAVQKRSLWSVIDSRWGDADKFTIMTTNMSTVSTEYGQGLIDWFGNSAWDRIQDDLLKVEMSGDSFRSLEE